MRKNFNNFYKLNKIATFFFIVIVVFAKFFNLESRSFSLDELYSVCSALEPNYQKFLQNWVLYDSNPPLYYFFLRFWLKIFPATEFWARFPSVIFVLLASWFFINGIRKRFHHGEWKSLLLLVGCSYSFLFFAQEARAYAMLLLFAVLQLLCFIDLLQPEEKNFRRKLWYFTVFSILSSYTHYTGILVSALLFGILMVCHYKHILILKKLILGVFISFAAGLFWLPYFWVIVQMNKSFIVDQDVSVVKNIIVMLFFGYEAIGKVFNAILLIAIFGICCLKIKAMRKSGFKEKSVMLLGLFFLMILSSPIIPYFFSYRHYIILIPLILLAIAILSTSVDFSKKTQIIFMVAAIVISVSEGATHYKSKREEWRQAVEYIV